jgi:hypothetical protein
MRLLFILLGALIVIAGIVLLISPEILFNVLEDNSNNSWVYIGAIVIRLILGVLLILYARESKYPMAIKVVGYIAVIAAIMLIFIGQEGFQDLISEVLHVFSSFGRIAGFVVIALGGFLMYAFSGNIEVKR